MAEDEDLDEDGEGAPKKGGKKKLIMIAGGALVLLLVGGGAAFFLMGGDDAPAPAAAADGAAPAGPQGAEAAALELASAKPVYLPMPDILVNLSGGERGATYLKVGATLQLAGGTNIASIESSLAVVIDAFQGFLREMRPADLTGSAGLLRLKEELLIRSNAALEDAPVRDVLLTELLVQ